MKALLMSMSVVAATFALAGCGGGSAATVNDHDRGIVIDIVKKMATLSQEAIPLEACVSDCNRAGLRRLRTHARLISNQAKDQAATVEAPCLRRAMITFSASLGALEGYADEVLAGSLGLAALGRSDNLRRRAVQRLVSCGYMKRGESVGLEVSLAYQQVGNAITGIDHCKTPSCFEKKGRAIKAAADLGLSRLASFSGQVTPCVDALLVTVRGYLTAWSRYGAAATKLRANVMETEVARAQRLATKLSAGARSCVSSLSP